MKKIKVNPIRLITSVLAGLILIIAIIYFTSLAPIGPMSEALPYLQNASTVQVDQGDYAFFQPKGHPTQTGFIFYPGGRVDYRSYAPLAHKLAEKGWPVAIVPMPLNLALLGSNRAEMVIKDHPEIPRWAIGGHSLGGSMAAQFEVDHPSTTIGIVFLASYPPGNDLAATSLQTLSIYASEDGLIPLSEWDTYRPRFPSLTKWKIIQGGNHAGFGWYGKQKGDNPATISLQDQTDQIVQTIDQFLHSNDYVSK